MDNLQLNIEAIIFASEQPVSVEELCLFFNKQADDNPLDEEYVAGLIQVIIEKYQHEMFPFEVGKVGGGYQFLTKGKLHESVSAYLNRNTIKRLSQAALETLSIIAYKQPVTKTIIETIRGVNADYTVQKLMELELIEIAGRSEEVGKPLLYKTTPLFLDYFGINALEELPKLREFEEIQNQIGEQENIEQQDQLS